MHDNLESLFSELARAAKLYTHLKYGRRAVGISIQFSDCSATHHEPFPEESGCGPAYGKAPPRLPHWDSGGTPKHLSDFQRVYWPGLGAFTFSESQALVVAALWDAWQADQPEVPQGKLLKAAGSESTRLADLFKGHPAWGELIKSRGNTGLYRLPVLAEDAAA